MSLNRDEYDKLNSKYKALKNNISRIEDRLFKLEAAQRMREETVDEKEKRKRKKTEEKHAQKLADEAELAKIKSSKKPITYIGENF
jgi:adenine-specific DNA glycosylase